MSIKKRRNIKLYDHVEQFISSFSMSKVAADNKLPTNLSTGCPIKWTFHTKMARLFGLGSCSKLVISVTEHLVEVVDKLSTTAVVFFRSERILKCKHLYGA